jgi:uncharacterized membrane protein
MELAHAEEPRSFVLVARRNDSLSPAGRKLVLVSFVLVSLAVSLPFALQGAWLILPFAGAELLGLWLAFTVFARHAGDFESISIDGDRVVIEQWETGRVRRHEMHRCWARVVYDPGGFGRETALAVRSHGREVAFGRHLTDAQRSAVARMLQDQLKRVG